jgi:hypothetical protein
MELATREELIEYSLKLRSSQVVAQMIQIPIALLRVFRIDECGSFPVHDNLGDHFSRLCKAILTNDFPVCIICQEIRLAACEHSRVLRVEMGRFVVLDGGRLESKTHIGSMYLHGLFADHTWCGWSSLRIISCHARAQRRFVAISRWD